jgi:glucosamine-6-phosphate deaminase
MQDQTAHNLQIALQVLNAQTHISNLRVSMKLAHEIRNQLLVKPACSIALPTGRTPVGTYRILSTWSMNHKIDWSYAKCFGLDEYMDVEAKDSYRTFLRDQLLRHTNLPLSSQFNPLLNARYDDLIASHGGLDLTVLGIGYNGHIAFNEPGTSMESWTHCVLLDESTRAANSELFSDQSSVPTKAVTMGIRTILESKRIILVPTDVRKRSILAEALRGPITTTLPASFLQLHPNLSVYTDFAW